MIIEGTTRIAASPEQVFEYLADPTRWSEYDPTLVEATPRERLTVGATGSVRIRRMGITAKATWTTTELEPPVRVTQYLRGLGYELTESVKLTAVDGGTDMYVVDHAAPDVPRRSCVRGHVARDRGARPAGAVATAQGAGGARGAGGALSDLAIRSTSSFRPDPRSGGPSIAGSRATALGFVTVPAPDSRDSRPSGR